MDITAPTGQLFIGYFFTVFMAYMNVCTNPFIYALKHDGVKQRLANLIICHKDAVVGNDSGSDTGRMEHVQRRTAH